MSDCDKLFRDHLRRYRTRMAQVGFLGTSDVLPRDSCGLMPLLRQGVDAANTQASPGTAENRPVTTVKRFDQLLDDLCSGRHDRLFVTGPGGSGKSECLRLLAYELAVEGGPLVPVFVPLGRWRDGEDVLDSAIGISPDAVRSLAQGGRRALTRRPHEACQP